MEGARREEEESKDLDDVRKGYHRFIVSSIRTENNCSEFVIVCPALVIGCRKHAVCYYSMWLELLSDLRYCRNRR